MGYRIKGQDDIAPRTWKGCAWRMERWKDPADRIGTKDPGGSWPRYLIKERTSTTNDIGGWKSGQRLLLGSGGMHMKALYEMVSLDIAKEIAVFYFAGVILNHDNENVRNIGQGEARHRKHKRLKLGGGEAYDRSSV
jgi:hypothetical protein